MSCWRVTIWVIADLKRLKITVPTSNSPASNISMTRLATFWRVAEAQPRPAEIGDGLDDDAGEVAAQLVAALAADAPGS